MFVFPTQSLSVKETTFSILKWRWKNKHIYQKNRDTECQCVFVCVFYREKGDSTKTYKFIHQAETEQHKT